MELLDIYDDYGNKTGRTVVRGDKKAVFSEHEHIAIAVIFIENDKGEYLIQKTSPEKGGLYSTTGGHIDSGETPLQAIIRETKEEIGVDIRDDYILDFGFLLYDFPLRYIFYVKKNIDINKIKVQKEEVEYVKYMSVDKIQELIKNHEVLVSHGVMFNEFLKIKANNLK